MLRKSPGARSSARFSLRRAAAPALQVTEAEAPSAQWTLEDALEEQWRKPFSELSVFRDVFRLSPRIQVNQVSSLGSEGEKRQLGTDSGMESARAGFGGVFDVFFVPSLRVNPQRGTFGSISIRHNELY
jgi:hypothetical protein